MICRGLNIYRNGFGCLVGHPGNQRATGDQPQRPGQATRVQPIQAPQLSMEEIRESTDNFGPKSLIGEGSYGRVYYATLQDRVAAIKKLDASAQPDAEFLAQVRHWLSRMESSPVDALSNS